MSDPRRRRGADAEDLVADRLSATGWTLLGRNVRTRLGEIDLIARNGPHLVFVEVKSGTIGSQFGPERPVFAVGPQKQLRLRRLAREWLSQNRPPPSCSGVRFDVVGVTYSRAGKAIGYEHIENAF